MTIKFFKNITNQATLRKAFVQLLKMYHPDNGGDAETCKQINAEYEYLMKHLPKTEEAGTEEDKKAAADLDKEIRKALEKVIHIDGINIEVVGTWIWIDGNTFPHREELKSLGYEWSKKRKKWHFTPYEKGNYYKGKQPDFEKLRSLYGSSKIIKENKKLLSA
jgi:hypothetical protein